MLLNIMPPNKVKKAAKSRFFSIETPPAKPSVNSATSSKYFVDSPSSAIGSFRTMPNFLQTLIPSQEVIQESATRRSTQAQCRCRLLARAAGKQFEHCRAFTEMHQRTNAPQGGEGCGISCCDLETLAVIKSVSHLCSHACYLRAFAPFRDWHSLRKSVAELSGQSPDCVLQGWRCSLAESPVDFTDVSDGNRKRKSVSSARREPSVQTVYIGPNGQRFKSLQPVMNELVIEQDSARTICPPLQRLRHVPECSHEQQSVLTRTAYTVFALCDVSPFGFLEELFCDNPWRMLLSTIMLQRTTRVQVDVVLAKFLQKWSDASNVSMAHEDEMAALIAPLGMRHRRAKGIIRFSHEWLALLARQDEGDINDSSNCDSFSGLRLKRPRDSNDCAFLLTREEVTSLYYCGDYAYDAYRIFIQRKLDTVPTDHALQIYVDFHRGLEKTQRIKSRSLSRSSHL